MRFAAPDSDTNNRIFDDFHAFLASLLEKYGEEYLAQNTGFFCGARNPAMGGHAGISIRGQGQGEIVVQTITAMIDGTCHQMALRSGEPIEGFYRHMIAEIEDGLRRLVVRTGSGTSKEINVEREDQ